jgi:hypothetical protein
MMSVFSFSTAEEGHGTINEIPKIQTSNSSAVMYAVMHSYFLKITSPLCL